MFALTIAPTAKNGSAASGLSRALREAALEHDPVGAVGAEHAGGELADVERERLGRALHRAQAR